MKLLSARPSTSSLMNDYLQPDFYRFNRDSLELVKRIKTRVFSSDSILDLGAGCGVLGLELARHYHPKNLTLLELQEDFRPYLEKNTKFFVPKETQTEIVISSFAEWSHPPLYDLIVCNPPYYLSDSGQASADERRGKARSFVVDDWNILLGLIVKCKKENGLAFLVLKNDRKIMQTLLKASSTQGISPQIEEFHDMIFIEV